MRIILLISFYVIVFSANAQKTIKIRKGRTLNGFYQLQTEDKTKEFLYFTKEGSVALISSSKRKKARGNLISCIENNNCQTAKKSKYKIDSLDISFSFNRGKGENIYFVEFDGHVSNDGLFITLKKGETGKLVEVKEFRRLKD